MLYVVVRDIEGGSQHDDVVFPTLLEAQGCYKQAELVGDNDPDEFGDGDPTIVSQCWLYATDTDDPAMARALVRGGLAVVISEYSKESFSDTRRNTVTMRNR
jgi:hypothetical protein